MEDIIKRDWEGHYIHSRMGTSWIYCKRLSVDWFPLKESEKPVENPQAIDNWENICTK